MCHKFTRIFALLALALISTAAYGQDRAPFALELPELNTGQLRSVNNSIARTDVNIVKFWIADPYASMMNWSDIKVAVNAKAATTVCHQRASSSGKMLLCDLNRLVGFKLDGNKNVFEIDARTKDGTRYFASFVMLTEQSRAIAKDALKFSGRKFAVIIGVSKYKNNDAGLTDLAFADKDAEALFQLLTQGGFNSNDILFLTNERATLSAVRDSLARFLTRAAPTDMILFFLAGHGTPDPYDNLNLYYLVHDSKVADLKNTALPMLELKQMIDQKLQAKRAVFLLDTCHSAGVSGTKIIPKPAAAASDDSDYDPLRQISPDSTGGKKPAPASGARQLVLGGSSNAKNNAGNNNADNNNANSNNANDFLAKQLFNQEGRAVLTSSDVNETSAESTRWGGGHGVFTWALLEGLRGLADANTDKTVTAGELFDYVSKRVRQETRNKQNPRALPGLNAGLELGVIR